MWFLVNYFLCEKVNNKKVFCCCWQVLLSVLIKFLCDFFLCMEHYFFLLLFCTTCLGEVVAENLIYFEKKCLGEIFKSFLVKFILRENNCKIKYCKLLKKKKKVFLRDSMRAPSRFSSVLQPQVFPWKIPRESTLRRSTVLPPSTLL